MGNYKFIARDTTGIRREGLRQAGTPNEVLAYLREMGFTPVAVEEIAAKVKQTRKFIPRGVKSAELSALCWQLTTMLEGGILITTALETIASDIENRQFQRVLEQIVEYIRKGETLSDSVSKFPHVFNRLACALILAGETGGSLPLSLRRLAEYYDNRDKLTRKVKGAIAYPVFVLCFIVLILIFIMTFIIPRFRAIFTQIGGELPAFTRGFMYVYDILYFNMLYFIVVTVLLVIAVTYIYKRTKKGHIWFSRMFLKLPLLGKIMKYAFVATLCRTMSNLLGAGIQVLEVFDILSSMTNNDIIKGAIIKTKEHIVEGASISLSMSAAAFFPNMLIKMVQVGEESGSITTVLDRTADYYERRVDSTISTLMTLLEPLMIITVGAIVLVVVLALYLPIFSMSDIKK